MTFSVFLCSAVWLTVAATAALVLYVNASPARRSCARIFFARPLTQTAALLALFGLFIGCFAALPAEGGLSVLGAAANAAGAGMTEAGASAPFAMTDSTGAALAHVAYQMRATSTPLLHISKYSLVAVIAGGVTAVATVLLGAALTASRRSIALTDALEGLAKSYWRPSIVTGTILWMLLTWVLLIWPDWHIFGTAADGTDCFGTALTALNWGTCALSWILIFSLVFRLRR